jgi:hypothetical protein
MLAAARPNSVHSQKMASQSASGWGPAAFNFEVHQRPIVPNCENSRLILIGLPGVTNKVDGIAAAATAPVPAAVKKSRLFIFFAPAQRFDGEKIGAIKGDIFPTERGLRQIGQEPCVQSDCAQGDRSCCGSCRNCSSASAPSVAHKKRVHNDAVSRYCTGSSTEYLCRCSTFHVRTSARGTLHC